MPAIACVSISRTCCVSHTRTVWCARRLPQAPCHRKCASCGTGWKAQGVEVRLFDRGTPDRGDQDMPDRVLQLRMLEDALDFNADPGIAVLLTGDGAGYLEGAGFHSTLERMHRRGWRVEILSWAHSTNQRMRRWAEANGIFVSLDDFYESITFMVPSRPGFELAPSRDPAELNHVPPAHLPNSGNRAVGSDQL